MAWNNKQNQFKLMNPQAAGQRTTAVKNAANQFGITPPSMGLPNQLAPLDEKEIKLRALRNIASGKKGF